MGVSLSGAGDAALIGAWYDREFTGAAWVFTRSGSVWSQQSAKLVGDCTHSCSGPDGSGEIGGSGFGARVALPREGDAALIGAPGDDGGAGAAWS